MDNINLDDYKRGCKQVCVSLSLSDYFFIKKSNFSPSRLLRKSIHNLRNSKSQDDLKEMFSKLQAQSNIIQTAMEFIESKDKSDEFFAYQEKKELDDLKIKKNRELVKKDTEKEIKEVLGEVE